MARTFRILAALAVLIGFGWSQAHAQVPLTGAGRGAPAGGGGTSIAFVNSADGGNTTGTSLTFSYTTGSGSHRLLVVPVVGDTSTDFITGVTYNGAAMTLAKKFAPASTSNRWSYLFYILNPTSGANNVVVSASSSTFIASGAADYTGVQQSGQPDASATNNGTPGVSITSLASSLTTVADNSWVILVASGFSGNAAPTAGTGSTRRNFDAAFGSWGLFDSNAPIHPAGSYSMTTGYPGGGSDTIDHILVSFVPG